MRSTLALTVFLSSIFMGLACALDSGQSLTRSDYGERLPDSSAEVALWRAASGWKVDRDRPLPEAKANGLALSLAANEYEAAQLVLYPAAPLTGLTFTPTDLMGPGGKVLEAKHIEVLRVAYVQVTRPTDRSSLAGWWPDPLPPVQKPLLLEAGRQHPFWIRVHAPKGTPAGVYHGSIALKAENYTATVALEVRVFAFTLPETSTCTSAMGLSMGAVTQYQRLKTPEECALVWEKYLDNLSKHRISPYSPALSSYGVSWRPLKEGEGGDLPASDRTLLAEHPLIPEFDWTAWDPQMQKGIEEYHFNSFRLYLPGLGSGTFYGRSGPALQGFAEDTREYELALSAYCQKLEDHLREKGWLEEAYLYWFDEPAPRDYAFVKNGFLKSKRFAPDINRMITERVTPEMYGGPNIWCPTPLKLRPEYAQQRQALGEKMWWYLCTVPKKPFVGLFIDRAATDLRVWLWQTWQQNITGILVWQVNLWTTGMAYPNTPQNPYEDPMAWMTGYGTKKGEKRPWGNGDGRFIYPPEAAASAQQEETILDGPVDSIRWEMLRDGLEDYEYFALLKKLLNEKSHCLDADLQRQCRKLLEVPRSVSKELREFTVAPDPIERHRLRLAEAIERILASAE